MSSMRGQLKRSVHVWCGYLGWCDNEDDQPSVRDLRRVGWRQYPLYGWVCPDCRGHCEQRAEGAQGR